MTIRQLTVYVENKKGALVEITTKLAENGIDLRAMSIADTKDFGILRLIVSDTDKAVEVLHGMGILVKVTDVLGVKISDEIGNLSQALQVLDDNGINLEYLYAFLLRTDKHAYTVLRVEDNEHASQCLINAGFSIITDSDIAKLLR